MLVEGGSSMKVESRRSYKCGFVLTEQELRRLVDLVTEQFSKLPIGQPANVEYQIKYKNGVIADTTSLEDILTQENAGSSQLIKLRAQFRIPDQPHEPQEVLFWFIDADADEEEGATSVRYLIRGNSRDWVFITSSLIEERIQKVKRFAFNELFTRRKALVPLVLGMMISVLLFPISFALEAAKPGQSHAAIEKVKQRWAAKDLSDPVEAIILLEEAKASTGSVTLTRLLPVIVVPVVLLFLFMGSIWFVTKYYPIFNFCWGDYVEIFRQKEAARKFWLIVIGLGLLVSFVGSVLANVIGKY
jgi:hypothetical protein